MVLLSLEVPEVALALLQHLASDGPGSSPERPVLMSNFFMEHSNPANGYVRANPAAASHKNAITEHLMAAWQWLLREGLLMPARGNTQGWVCVSTRGHQAVSRETFDKFRHAALLPQAMLHPSVAATAYSAFLRGDFDIAIFASFRAVENAVRVACKYPNNLVGAPLMRKAFDVLSGPLTDANLVASEQQAMSDVFAGAMGLFKNPTSHRMDAFDTPEQAVSLVVFANYLINLVDERGRANGLIP
jgi:uncharacterized protein (TIGR02391 family)